MELDNGIICQFNSSWTVRVRRDDLFVMQVDGSKGSAVGQSARLPDPGSGCDSLSPFGIRILNNQSTFYDGWSEVPDATTYDNAFKIQWELFLRHVALDEPFPYDLRSGAKGVELAELGLRSWAERKWIDL
jgi:predicted dehydrogenase